MPLRVPTNRYSLIVKMAIVLWGMESWLQGATLSFFVSGAHQNRATAFIELVYFSVLLGGLLSFISTRIAALCFSAATVAALSILLWTQTFGHGASDAPFFLLSIAVRPALMAVVLFFTYRYERQQERRSGHENQQSSS